jgi:hypothetical protein
MAPPIKNAYEDTLTRSARLREFNSKESVDLTFSSSTSSLPKVIVIRLGFQRVFLLKETIVLLLEV